MAKVHVSTLECHHFYHRNSGHLPPIRRVVTTWNPFIVKDPRRRILLQPCRSFKPEDVSEYVKGSKSVNKLVGAIRSAVWSCSKPSLRTENKLREAMEKLEERLFLLALYVGRYIITMTSTGVVMFVGFQLSVVGIACDVSEPVDVRNLGKFAADELGYIDIWVNNAGTNKGFRPLLQFTDNDIQEIVSTNLIGSMLCTKEAIQIMKTQSKGGHVFNMDGAGSGGSSTPLTAVYGSTKCGLRQLQSSLLKECKRSNVGVHTASPGMVLTDLLLSGSTIQNRQMFNIICEHPETVARTLVPRMRVVKGSGRAINYLTPPRILIALVTAWLRRGRWFDDQGRALYAAEADRLRNWAESRTRLSFTDAMEMYTENTWISVFSLSVVCAFIILSSTGST
ncbi:unnamed protein product [Withania somnifera]